MKQLKKIYWKRIGVIGISCFMLLWSCLLTGCGIGKGDSGKPAACTISIDCQTILDNIGDLKETKKEFVPEDGWILPEVEVKFTTGDTVFDIPFIARYQVMNAALAVKTIQVLEDQIPDAGFFQPLIIIKLGKIIHLLLDQYIGSTVRTIIQICIRQERSTVYAVHPLLLILHVCCS